MLETEAVKSKLKNLGLLERILVRVLGRRRRRRFGDLFGHRRILRAQFDDGSTYSGIFQQQIRRSCRGGADKEVEIIKKKKKLRQFLDYCVG